DAGRHGHLPASRGQGQGGHLLVVLDLHVQLPTVRRQLPMRLNGAQKNGCDMAGFFSTASWPACIARWMSRPLASSAYSVVISTSVASSDTDHSDEIRLDVPADRNERVKPS